MRCLPRTSNLPASRGATLKIPRRRSIRWVWKPLSLNWWIHECVNVPVCRHDAFTETLCFFSPAHSVTYLRLLCLKFQNLSLEKWKNRRWTVWWNQRGATRFLFQVLVLWVWLHTIGPDPEWQGDVYLAQAKLQQTSGCSQPHFIQESVPIMKCFNQIVAYSKMCILILLSGCSTEKWQHVSQELHQLFTIYAGK